jgi:hypothetical protein
MNYSSADPIEYLEAMYLELVEQGDLSRETLHMAARQKNLFWNLDGLPCLEAEESKRCLTQEAAMCERIAQACTPVSLWHTCMHRCELAYMRQRFEWLCAIEDVMNPRNLRRGKRRETKTQYHKQVKSELKWAIFVERYPQHLKVDPTKWTRIYNTTEEGKKFHRHFRESRTWWLASKGASDLSVLAFSAHLSAHRVGDVVKDLKPKDFPALTIPSEMAMMEKYVRNRFRILNGQHKPHVAVKGNGDLAHLVY